jgi:ADP-heptose:LPS heptosyltransferase
MKTLLIRAGGLGDTILSLFAGQWLSSAQGHDVTVMVQRRHAQLAALFGFNAVSEEECDFQSAFSTPSSRLVEALKPFDAVIAIKKETGNLRTAVKGEFARIAPLPPADCAIPYPMFIIHGAADALKIDPPETLPRLEPKIKWAKPLLRHLVFAVGSGSLTKNWPLCNFIRLIELARAKGFEKFTAIHGPAEMERDPGSAESLAGISGVCALIAPSLHDLASAIAGASVFVGADSGVTHLAPLVGAPTVALFGPTNPIVWGPVGDCVTVIHAPSGRMNDIAVESVMEAIVCCMGDPVGRSV